MGLTDNENYGGREALGHATAGWVWTTGEPVIYTNWRHDEPGDWEGEGGEDAVLMEKFGIWNDCPSGEAGQKSLLCRYIVEWEVQSKEPVAGARALKPVLPEKWAADFTAKPPGGQPWGVWTCGVENPAGETKPLQGKGLRPLLEILARDAKGAPPFGAGALQFKNTADGSAWFGLATDFRHPVSKGVFGVLYAATIHVEKEEKWSFLVMADDSAALRIPGMKWIAAGADSFIDPLDPATIVQEHPAWEGMLLGTVLLPAGQHRIELAYGNNGGNSAVHIAAAPGEHLLPGATDRWRTLGSKPAGKIAWPTVKEPGWHVQASAPLDRKREGDYKLLAATEGLELQGDGVDVPQLNWTDDGAPLTPVFPDAKPLPGDLSGDQNFKVTVAEATLVIPEDGDWHIGFTTDSTGAVSIEGGVWRSITRARWSSAKLAGDTLFTEEAGSRAVTGLIPLKKGEYPIRALHVEKFGPAGFTVFASKAGYPPRILRGGEPVSEEDVAGLQLVTP